MKKVLIGLVALLLLVVGGLVLVWTNLDSIVKTAIETYGSEATHTAVRVKEVKLALEDGQAKISGLSVANPPGYTDPNIFELGGISTKVDTSTLNQNPIVIDEIVISDPAVVYEINKDGVANADVLKKNLASGSSGGEEKPAAEKEEKGEQLKMIIRKIVVEGSTARVRIAALKQDQTVKLQKIVMTDVGKKSGGATAVEVATQLSNRILTNVKSSVMKIGVDKYLGKSADAIKQQMQQKMDSNKMGDTLKGVFGN
jgi:hypothetical protein